VAAGGEVGLRATVADAAGNAAAGTPLFLSSAGQVREVEPEGPGAWRATLSAPERFGRALEIEVVARLDGVSGRAAVALQPGSVERLALGGPDAGIPADGEAEVVLPFEPADRFGNRVDAAPEVSAERGQAVAARAGGRWQVRYRPPRLDEGGQDTVHARIGQVAGSTQLRLERRPRALDLWLRLGVAVRAGNPLAPSAGLAALYRPRRFRGQVGFGLEASWSSLTRRDTLSDGGVPVALRSTSSFAGLQAVAAYRRSIDSRLVAWALLGAGGALASTRLVQAGLPALSGSTWVPRLDGALALGLRSGPFAEARLAWQGDARAEALRGSVTTFMLSLGWRLETL
jgi:hypothetical protein